MAMIRREMPSGLVRMDGTMAPRRRGMLAHPLLTAAFAAAAIVIAYQLLSGLLFWTQLRLDDLRYGYPRSSQMEGYVGFGESNGQPTHFMALNLHRQVVVLYIAGDNPTHVSTIKGPLLYGANEEYAPVTMRLVDVTGDGYPDLVLSVDRQQIVYVDQPRLASFRPLLPAERAAAARVLGVSP